MTIWNAFWTNLASGELFTAAWVTIGLAIGAQLIGVIVGSVVAAVRLAPWRPMRALGWFYVWFIRGTAELLQIIALYAVLPLVGIRLELLQVGLLGLGLNEGARMSEIVRAGIISVPRGQWDAARALGMTRGHLARLVVLPQAARVILPPTGNEINYMFKTTSLVSVIGITELLRESELTAQTQAEPLAIFLAATVYYLIITSAWDVVQRIIERRYQYGGGQGHLASWPRTFRQRSGTVHSRVVEHSA